MLRRESIPFSDFEAALRKNRCESIDEVTLAVLEANGTISVLKKGDKA